jgi:hypothetical protein
MGRTPRQGNDMQTRRRSELVVANQDGNGHSHRHVGQVKGKQRTWKWREGEKA